MNRKIIIRAMAAIALMLAANISVQAQVGGALNRARNAAQGATQGTTNTPAGEAVTEKAAATDATATLSPEMRAAIDKLKDESKRSAPAVKELSNESVLDDWFSGTGANRGNDIHTLHTEAEVKAFKAAIEARTKENLEIYLAFYGVYNHDTRYFMNTYEIERDTEGFKPEVKEVVKMDDFRPLRDELFNYKTAMSRATNMVSLYGEVKRGASGELERVNLLNITGLEKTPEGAVFRINGIITPERNDVYERFVNRFLYAKILLHIDGGEQGKQYNGYLIAEMGNDVYKEAQVNSMRMQEKLPVPAAKMNDAALAAKMVQLTNAQYPERTAVKAIITDATWQFDRELGQIVRRRITAAIITRRPDGTYYLSYLGFAQPHTGGGNYGETVLYGVSTLPGGAVDYKE
jgi:hypothetical protein